MAKTKKPAFEIPRKLLDQINEFSAGGFFMMVLDEHGNPKVYSRYDSQIHATAMQYYLNKFAESIEQINMDITCNNILQGARRK